MPTAWIRPTFGERLRTSGVRLLNESARDTLAIVGETFVKLTFANVREHALVHAREGRDARKTFAFKLAPERSTNVKRSFIS